MKYLFIFLSYTLFADHQIQLVCKNQLASLRSNGCHPIVIKGKRLENYFKEKLSLKDCKSKNLIGIIDTPKCIIEQSHSTLGKGKVGNPNAINLEKFLDQRKYSNTLPSRAH